ncbi:MAG: hypothetical protein U1E65_21045 [Myxococcota bacterium]
MKTTWWLALSMLLASSCASTPVKGGNMSGLKERQMAKCPSAVPTAKTTVEDTADGVEVSIVGSAEGSEATIRDLSGEQAAVEVDLDKPSHTGEGTGGGVVGHCPILHLGTVVTVVNIPGGAKIIIKPKVAEKLADVRKTVHDRVDALPK